MEYVLNQYKTQEMCEIPVGGWAFALKYVSHKCNTQKMSNEAEEEEHLLLEVVPDKYRTKWMCEKAFRRELDALKFVSNQYKAQVKKL